VQSPWAFAGPRKGVKLKAIPTVTTQWGYWTETYPSSVTYTMFEKYQPIELPKSDNADSLKSRGPADKRLPTNTAVIGVTYEGKTRAYRLADVEKAGGLIRDEIGGKPVIVLAYAPTQSAAAYAPQIDGAKSTQLVNLTPQKDGSFIDDKTKSRWGVDGRAQSGPLKGKTLRWIDSVQCRWFAWAAEYPETELYSRGETAK